jgi:hypothetical protein
MDKSGAGTGFLLELRIPHANLHSICFSTIIFTITRGWHNRPGVAAVPIASQTRIKKKWDLWWTKWHWGRFSSSTSVFPAYCDSTNYSILIYHSGLVGRHTESITTSKTIFRDIEALIRFCSVYFYAYYVYWLCILWDTLSPHSF